VVAIVFFYEYILKVIQISGKIKKNDIKGEVFMLLDEIVGYCDNQYINYHGNCGCETCNHEDKCSGNCYTCLYQIHFPDRFLGKIIKHKYDCQKMMYFYVCQYSYRYATQILYAFNRYRDTIMNMNKIRLMSLGCGGCPDLMAIEKFCHDNRYTGDIAYKGYDINTLWRPIHSEVKKYCDNNNIQRTFIENDVITYFSKYYVPNVNIIVISYLISSLYNTGQISKIDTLFTEIRDNVVKRKKSGEKLLIIINDINHNIKARNYFKNLYDILKRENNLSVRCEYVYFDTGDLYSKQKVGSAYSSRDFLFTPDVNIQQKYSAGHCVDTQTIQFIVEVE